MKRDRKHARRQREIDGLLQQPRGTDTFGDELLANLETIRPQTLPDVARAIADHVSGSKRKGSDQ